MVWYGRDVERSYDLTNLSVKPDNEYRHKMARSGAGCGRGCSEIRLGPNHRFGGLHGLAQGHRTEIEGQGSMAARRRPSG